MPQLRQFIYFSATPPTNSRAVERQIVGLAKLHNCRAALTGIIALSGRHFLQVIEGPTEGVEDLLPKLAAELRHRDIRTLADRSIQACRYASWSMGYVYTLDLVDALQRLHEGSTLIGFEALLDKLDPELLADSAFGPMSSFGQLGS